MTLTARAVTVCTGCAQPGQPFVRESSCMCVDQRAMAQNQCRQGTQCVRQQVAPFSPAPPPPPACPACRPQQPCNTRHPVSCKSIPLPAHLHVLDGVLMHPPYTRRKANHSKQQQQPTYSNAPACPGWRPRALVPPAASRQSQCPSGEPGPSSSSSSSRNGEPVHVWQQLKQQNQRAGNAPRLQVT
jgi:hypothetical protein